MADDKKGLGSFTVGGMGGGLPGMGPRPPVGGAPTPTAQASAQAQTEDAPSGIFPNLEALIERSNEDLSAFGEEMGAVCQHLDELIEKRTGRVKQEAQYARQAYERTFDMINHLLQVKASLLAGDEAAENS
ncbi:MAG: hypothetical protein EP343_32465 [Deltaproteobacteria bacterium]|nr:MAG: hypothetical protein EP343_32465 [Deltaproteobacteria bacterium]